MEREVAETLPEEADKNAEAEEARIEATTTLNIFSDFMCNIIIDSVQLRRTLCGWIWGIMSRVTGICSYTFCLHLHKITIRRAVYECKK